MAHQAIGDAIRLERMTSFKKSFDNNPANSPPEAPKTFRMPISFVLLSAVYAARPNNPRHDMNMASRAKIAASFSISVSVVNMVLN